MTQNWRDYQEEAAALFRSLGMTASTNVRLNGVRTSHDVDVWVEMEIAGFEAKWVVECKYWKRPVNKVHILALREILSDLGADRGIILSEAGFQSGAISAANSTNVLLSSIADIKSTSESAIAMFRLRELFDRACTARDRYWSLPKHHRIATGLRGDGHDPSFTYSGARVAEATENILSIAFRELYPIVVDALDAFKLNRSLPIILSGPMEVVSFLHPVITELETKIESSFRQIGE